MTAARRPVLIAVRPADRAAQTMTAFDGSGYDLRFCNVFTYSKTDTAFDIAKSYQGLIVTSLRAIEVMGDVPSALLSLPLFIVGEASATRAAGMGFQNIAAVVPRAADLIPLIHKIAQPDQGPLLYVRGDHVSYPVESELANLSYSVDARVTYRTASHSALDNDIINMIKMSQVAAVLLFSAQSAAQFCKLVEGAGLREHMHSISALCLSDAVLEYAHNLPWARTYTASTPDLAGMVALVRTLPAAP